MVLLVGWKDDPAEVMVAQTKGHLIKSLVWEVVSNH